MMIKECNELVGAVNEKEDTKCNNKIKWYKKWLTLMMLEKKT